MSALYDFFGDLTVCVYESGRDVAKINWQKAEECYNKNMSVEDTANMSYDESGGSGELDDEGIPIL